MSQETPMTQKKRRRKHQTKRKPVKIVNLQVSYRISLDCASPRIVFLLRFTISLMLLVNFIAESK